MQGLSILSSWFIYDVILIRIYPKRLKIYIIPKKVTQSFIDF